MASFAEDLRYIVERASALRTPDEFIVFGSGELTSFLIAYEDENSQAILQSAVDSPVFARALNFAWYTGSPHFIRREQLMRDLGEVVDVSIRFKATPRGWPTESYGYRQLEIDSSLDGPSVAALLRTIADRCDG